MNKTLDEQTMESIFAMYDIGQIDVFKAIDMAEDLIAQETRNARIDELEHIAVDGMDGGTIYSSKDGEDIDIRIASLKKEKEGR